MSSLSPLSAAAMGAGAPAQGTADDAAADSRRALTADFNTFLTLLTTQMRNQDPLNPIQSTEFVAQLAQFSAVEQQIQTNQRLGRLIAAMSANGAGALGDWLGRSVRAEGPVAYAGGSVEAWTRGAPAGAETAALIVRDAQGAVVAERPFDPKAESVVWDGKRADGSDAPPGTYALSVRFGEANGATTNQPAETFQRVTEARRADGRITLLLAGGGRVDADAVTGVR